jgi:hypothetical protein
VVERCAGACGERCHHLGTVAFKADDQRYMPIAGRVRYFERGFGRLEEAA